jgi:3-methyl-2-oxobutanoate hydroxymethyltransferase
MIPAELAQRITSKLSIPTISVGAGSHTDGQLMVWTDFAGMNTGRVPKFVKQYAKLGEILGSAAKEFKSDVESGAYPGPEHSYEDN